MIAAQRAASRLQAQLRCVGERGNARLRYWKVVATELRCQPERCTAVVKAVLALHYTERDPFAALRVACPGPVVTRPQHLNRWHLRNPEPRGKLPNQGKNQGWTCQTGTRPAVTQDARSSVTTILATRSQSTDRGVMPWVLSHRPRGSGRLLGTA